MKFVPYIIIDFEVKTGSLGNLTRIVSRFSVDL